MKNTFQLVLLAIAATAVNANIFDDAATLLKSIPLRKKDVKPLFKKTETHKRAVPADIDMLHETQMRIASQREMLGLPRLGRIYGAGTGSITAFDSGIGGTLIGIFNGLMFHEGKANACFDSVETSLVGLDSLGNIMSHIYLPPYWTQAQMVTQDLVSL